MEQVLEAKDGLGMLDEEEDLQRALSGTKLLAADLEDEADPCRAVQHSVQGGSINISQDVAALGAQL